MIMSLGSYRIPKHLHHPCHTCLDNFLGTTYTFKLQGPGLTNLSTSACCHVQLPLWGMRTCQARVETRLGHYLKSPSVWATCPSGRSRSGNLLWLYFEQLGPVRISVLINLPGLGDIMCSSARWPIMSPHSLNREKSSLSSLPMACGLLMTLPQHLPWMIGTTTGTTRPGANVEELPRWLSIPNEQFLLKTLQFENVITLEKVGEAPATNDLEMLFTC